VTPSKFAKPRAPTTPNQIDARLGELLHEDGTLTEQDIKEILAVQAMPKMKTLKKSRRTKVTQSPTAFDWKLPIFSTQPFPSSKIGEERKRRKGE